MTGPLGRNQLALLKTMCASLSVVVADNLTRSLCKRGLMVEGMPDGMVSVTPDGLRALADAAERGQVVLGYTRPLPDVQFEVEK